MVGFDLDPELSLALRTGHDSKFSESTSSSEHATVIRDEICSANACEKRTMTIFYDGRMCTSNVTEIQARAIISMARREMENNARSKQKINSTNISPQKFVFDAKKNIGSFQDQSQFLSDSSQMLDQGVSMKQSLQRFLQKRKTRIASTSPYSRPNCTLA